MKNKINFMALGGGQQIGASSYFINVDGCNILLDCGCGMSDGLTYGPNLNGILSFVDSFSEVDAVFISHSHYDHIGYLPQFHAMAPNVPIYATTQTKILANHLIWDTGRRYEKNKKKSVITREELLAENALSSIITVGYSTKMSFPKFDITFYEAGHIPGAAMILIETENHKILYTGDFAKANTPLSEGYILPNDVSADTLILCGVHAACPEFTRHFSAKSLIRRLNGSLSKDITVLNVRQLTKGLEMAKLLNDAMEQSLIPEKTIFIDDDIWRLSERLETMGCYVLGKQCRPFPEASFKNGIYITESGALGQYYESERIDFSLHATYPEIKELIQKINPKSVLIVHTGNSEENINKHRIELDMNNEADSKSVFIYPENNEIYNI